MDDSLAADLQITPENSEEEDDDEEERAGKKTIMSLLHHLGHKDKSNSLNIYFLWPHWTFKCQSFYVILCRIDMVLNWKLEFPRVHFAFSGKLSSSGSDSDREDQYYETMDTGIQGASSAGQVHNFMVDDNAQDFSYENAIAMAQAAAAQYDDQGDDSFDPNEFFSSFANKGFNPNQQEGEEQQVGQQVEQVGQQIEQQVGQQVEQQVGQPPGADINTDLQLSESGSESDDNDFEDVNDNSHNVHQSQEYDLDELMQFQ